MGLKSAQNIREKKPLFIDIKILFFNRGKSVQKLKQKKMYLAINILHCWYIVYVYVLRKELFEHVAISFWWHWFEKMYEKNHNKMKLVGFFI